MPLSVSIQLSGPSFADRLRQRTTTAVRWARSKVLGVPLPSYERSRRELGGMPWRKLDDTEGWFLVSAQGLAAEADDYGMRPEREPSVDPGLEATPDLRKPMLSRRALAFVAVAGMVAASVVLIVTRGRAEPVAPPALVVSTAPAVPSVEAPASAEAPLPARAAVAKVGRERHAKRKPTHARGPRR